MNIVFFKTGIAYSGGMERVSIFMANEMAKVPENNVYYVSRVKEDPFFALNENVKLLYLTEKKEESLYLNWVKYVWLVSRIIKKYKIEKWIDVGSNMALISVPSKMFAKFDLFVWEHFNLTYVWNKYTTNIARWLACHFAKKVIVLTTTDRDRFDDRFHTGNIVTIPNPVTIREIPAGVAKEKMVLAVGRLSYQKGFDMLLDIWYQTKCRDDGWKLVIIGQGELLEQLETKKEFLGISSSVEILPANPQIESLYARSSLYVMSSRWEGLPLVLIESTSAGLPIVSFDCETGPRDIVKNGYNGYLVECFNLSDFASIIDKLCEDKELMRKMSDNSRVKSLEFNLESIIKQWNNILK